MNKLIISITLAFVVVVAVLLCCQQCESGKPQIKKIYVQGKSWTITEKKSDTTTHFNKAVQNLKPKIVYYPVHHWHHDSTQWRHLVDSLLNELATRVYSDTQQIGKAKIISNDSVKGSLLSRQVGCIGCFPDTVEKVRVDTLKTVEKLPSSKWSVGAHVGVTAGINLLPPYAPCICAGVGAGVNYKLIGK